MRRFGVAFDIDGVLTRAPRAIAGAKEALELLQAADVPFCLMTNGGGSAEHVKAKQISDLLGLSAARPLRAEQVCLAHTPMRGLVPALRDRPVLLVGKHYPKIKEIAASYGFRKAVTLEELHAAFPHMYPDIAPPPEALELVNTRHAAGESMWGCRYQQMPKQEQGGAMSGAMSGFAAVLVFTDPIEWGRELQLVVDVLGAPDGLVAGADSSTNSGTSSGGSNNNAGGGHAVQCQDVALHMACSDFLYAAQWHQPRFGAGAFRMALEHLWLGLHGEELQQTIYGKPFPAQYRYVETMLASLGADGGGGGGGGGSSPGLDRYYMVGDNPLTDIRGARNAGEQWRAILTRTGLWEGGENDEMDPADVVVPDVLEGVRWIMDQEKLSNRSGER
jgi:HAD superfamily hydrolase (TIGR01450 family)